MPPQETGKQRAARIPLDYYKHSDCLGKWKTRLGWLALIVPLAWLGTNFALSNQQDFYSSRGPVSAVHQTWDASCSTCHVNFTPISNHSFALADSGGRRGEFQAMPNLPRRPGSFRHAAR